MKLDRAERKQAQQIIRETIDNAVEAGEIGRGVGMVAKLFCRSRRFADDFDDLTDCCAEGLPATVAGPSGAIDWEAFAKFIQEILPSLLAFIQAIIPLFAV